jgi:hypothetical protein
MDPIRSQLNPYHTLTPHLSNNHVILGLLYCAQHLVETTYVALVRVFKWTVAMMLQTVQKYRLFYGIGNVKKGSC